MESIKSNDDIFTNAESGHSSKSGHYHDPKKVKHPRPPEKDNGFGDSDYDDPLSTQHLRLDFTPNDEFDNDFAQNKCCEFWNFINSLPEIQHLKVLPEKNILESMETQGTSETSDTEEYTGDDGATEPNALRVLEFIEEKGLINGVLETKIPRSQCSLGSRSHQEVLNIPQRKKKHRAGPCFLCCRSQDGGIPGSCPCNPSKHSPLKSLISSMEDWDRKHPRSMEPPQHPPRLQQCILQGNNVI